MSAEDYDQDIRENQDLIKELNLTHPCKNVCSGYRQVVEEATPEMLKTNNYVKALIEAHEWNAGTIVLDNMWALEDCKQNRLNLIRNINKAKEALRPFQGGEHE